MDIRTSLIILTITVLVLIAGLLIAFKREEQPSIDKITNKHRQKSRSHGHAD